MEGLALIFLFLTALFGFLAIGVPIAYTLVAPEPILDARGEPLGPRDCVPVPGAADVPELVVVVRRIRVYGVVDDRPVRRGPPQGRQGEGQDKQSGQQARCFSHERDKPPDLDFQARCP